MTGPRTDRKSTSDAAASYTRVVTISTEMVAPGLIGLWIDRQVGTKVAFAVGGFVLGMVLGILQIVALAREQSRKNALNETVEDEDIAGDAGGTNKENKPSS